jgi:hypothetical protein
MRWPDVEPFGSLGFNPAADNTPTWEHKGLRASLSITANSRSLPMGAVTIGFHI